MKYTCPVCMFPRLPYPPRDYHICPCCGTEFGNDDADFSYEQLREMWIAGGANWLQLLKAGFRTLLPPIAIDIRLQSNVIVGPGSIINPGQFCVSASA
jgi:hypothetical protein